MIRQRTADGRALRFISSSVLVVPSREIRGAVFPESGGRQPRQSSAGAPPPPSSGHGVAGAEGRRLTGAEARAPAGGDPDGRREGVT